VTEIVREFLGGFRHRAQSSATNPPSVALSVRVAVPDEASAAEMADLKRKFQEVFTTTMGELGIGRKVAVEVEPRTDGRDHVDVSADGRPVALFSAPVPDGDWPAAVCRLTHRRLLRRARVLLDDSETERLGALLPDVVPEGSRREVLDYLLDNGVALRQLATDPLPGNEQQTLTSVELAELLITNVAPRWLSIAVPEQILRNTLNHGRSAVVDLRVALFEELGARFPDFRIDSHDVGSGELRVRLNNVSSPSIKVGRSAAWPSAVSALRPVLAEHAAWFVRADEVDRTCRQLAMVVPDLVELTLSRVPLLRLSACVRSLLANADSVRNLPRIMWLLLDTAPSHGEIDQLMLAKPGGQSVETDPESLASTVRRLIAYEAWAGGEAMPTERWSTIALDVERALCEASDPGSTADAEWPIVRQVFASEHPAVVVVHQLAAVGPLRRALYALPAPPKVVASEELPPDLPLPAEVSR